MQKSLCLGNDASDKKTSSKQKKNKNQKINYHDSSSWEGGKQNHLAAHDLFTCKL